MTVKEKASTALLVLEKLYPAAECSLRYEGEPYKLLIMAILSAQCTDARVNEVSVPLFAAYPTAADLAAAPRTDIETIIHPVGLFRSKAKNIKAAAERLCSVYGGVLPSDMKELLSLAGVGRKVANLLRGDLFNLGGIVADTHCIRISGRLGLVKSNTPVGVERELDKLIPKDKQSDFCHRLVLFGREYCSAKKPNCQICPFKALDIHCKI
ncbi:MAG: endonuclease III [Clostridia bacterium]|nr:endonuclease III [Clostridia bacterium]